jgi:uncharacterized cupredoxin-like copper-binding protein
VDISGVGSLVRGRAGRRCLTGIIVAAVLASGCTTSSRAAEPAGVVGVRLRDFHIDLAQHTVRAGAVDLRLRNEGPTVHELIVVRTDLPAAHLPLGTDGLSVAESGTGVRKVDEQENVGLGQAASLRLRLTPGRYVVFCNLEGHYLAGMHGAVEVVR